LTAWLRHKKADGKPFYVCKNSHFKNVENAEKYAKPQEDRQTTTRVSKIVCPCCNTDIIVDVHASAFQNKTKVEPEKETKTADDDLPF
jgi:hypothetical protein